MTASRTTVSVVYLLKSPTSSGETDPKPVYVAHPPLQAAGAPKGAFGFYYISGDPVVLADGTVCPLRKDVDQTGKFYIRSRVMDFLDAKDAGSQWNKVLRFKFSQVLARHGCTHIVYVWPGIPPQPFFDEADVMLHWS